MGFLTGRSTFLRFRVVGPKPGLFGEDHLDRLRVFEAGRQKIAAADGVEIGWTAGDHILDADFRLDKNVVSETLHFELRVDIDKFPGDLLRAYYAIELKALAKENPSGLPSARQKREAKEYARERLEQESKDGRFKKRKCVPVLWDSATNEVLFGAAGLTHVDRMTSLFQQSFGLELEAITSGRRAYQLAELHQRTRSVDDSGPSAFVPGGTDGDGVAWIADEASRDFLGNEFLLWLWFMSDGDTDTVKLTDGTEATFMLARTLTLECPRGQTGHETISSDGPTRLPEARRAIQSGKLPRKAGITVVRHDHQYELTLHAETLAVGGAKFPPPDEENPVARQHERVGNLRHLIETLDLLYDAFGKARFGQQWPDTLGRMQRWLQRDERKAA